MAESQKILVTGGAGFIGTNLVNELRKRGHEVIAADLYNTERDNYIRTDVKSYAPFAGEAEIQDDLLFKR
jgi:dTDP-glucose 4,6-dehydratase